MKKVCKACIFFAICIAVCAVLFLLWHKSTGRITEVKNKKDDLYTCMYKGMEHEFLICDSAAGEDEGRSLVIMLHGYGSSAQGFQTMTNFDTKACEKGYVVCYVTCTVDPANKSDAGWNSGIGDSKKDDVGFLVKLAEYLQKEYRCSEKKTYVVGYSNGAFMVHRLAEEAGDTFSKCVSVAGMMPGNIWEKKKGRSDADFLQIYGSLDDVVPQKSNGSDKTSPHPAIEEVMEYRIDAGNLKAVEDIALSDRAKLTKYEDTDGTKKVWNVYINGGRHSWPDEKFAGFSVNDLILEFLE